MTDDEIKRITNMNRDLLYIIEFATPLILELIHLLPEEDQSVIVWIMQGLDNIIYKNKPFPPLTPIL